MTTPYEQHLLLQYLTNLASRLKYADKSARELWDWMIEHSHVLGCEDMETSYGKKLRKGSLSPVEDPRIMDISREEKLSRPQWKNLVTHLRAGYAATQNTPEDRTAHNIRMLGHKTGLSETDVAILNFLLRYKTQPIIESISDNVLNRLHRYHNHHLSEHHLSYFLDVSINTILRRLMRDAPLVRAGLVSMSKDDFEISDRLLERLSAIPDDNVDDVMDLLLDTTGPSELAWSDFDHIAQDRDHVERLLKGAMQTGATGVNILLYGPPGTGKTEFCKVMADRLGITLYGVGESDDEKREPSRRERLNELKLAQCLIGHDRQSLVLFDEMDDLLSHTEGHGVALFGFRSSGLRRGESKVFMNQLLEQATTPILWTTNIGGDIDPVILRRMTFVLELRTPTPKVRARIWARQLTRHGIEASADDALMLATEFRATPGVAAGATVAAQLIKGDLATVRHGVRNLSRVLSCHTPPQRPPARFDPAFLQTDEDMIRLADRLVHHEERRFSLCLQGPPGTGKSAFARHLAERMGLEVIQKRTSDLLSCWVGENERNIAAAFTEAHDTQSFLIFDEADSLLADRSHAARTWEVRQVNEMLTWMESHPYPFACTTNNGEGLDPASLRRFVFKITFDYLTSEQAAMVFRAYFDIAPTQELADLTMLTPGDFAVVRRKAEILHLLRDAPMLVDMLRAECDAKPDQKRQIRIQP